MIENGIDISNYRARQLNKEMIRKADLILVIESAHKIAIEESEQSAKEKVFRLGEWERFDIYVPYKHDLSVFVKSFNGKLINCYSPRNSTHNIELETINLYESKCYYP
jgi:protein-tyrosine-phosphatase